MCVIAVKPAGVKWPGKRAVRNCFKANPDGAGIAWTDDKGLHVVKGYFSFEPLWKKLLAVEKYPVLLHCRIATHGSVGAKNCHPFLLSGGIALAHNGIIPGFGSSRYMTYYRYANRPDTGADITDSEDFARKCVEPLSAKELGSPAVQGLLARIAGDDSKVAMLRKDGSFIFLNREAGVEYRGLWFSNSSYEPPKPAAYSGFSGGFSGGLSGGQGDLLAECAGLNGCGSRNYGDCDPACPWLADLEHEMGIEWSGGNIRPATQECSDLFGCGAGYDSRFDGCKDCARFARWGA